MPRGRAVLMPLVLTAILVAGVEQGRAELPQPDDFDIERIEEEQEREYRDEMPIYSVSEYEAPWITDDRNGDGRIDYAVLFNQSFQKVAEAVDHSHDGRMDDFYYYHRGDLVRQEIDTNHDGVVDLWIYLDGAYVERWERDTNHDGRADQVREY